MKEKRLKELESKLYKDEEHDITTFKTYGKYINLFGGYCNLVVICLGFISF